MHGQQNINPLTPNDLYRRRALSSLKIKIPSKNMREKPIRHDTPIHNILSTAPQWSISQKTLGTLPEDGNAMSKRVGATIHN
jgi:hypothetical protein